MTKWQYRNPLAWKTYLRQRVIQHLAFIKQEKNKPCTDCGQCYPSYVMDFDHVKGSKNANICQMASRSLKAIKLEISKCDLVCSNCHRERTYKRGEYKDYVKPIS